MRATITPTESVKTVADSIQDLIVQDDLSLREAATKATDQYGISSIAKAEWCHAQYYSAA